MRSPRTHPEQYGLQIVAELDLSDGGYTFDLIVVWMDEDGRLYAGEDAGCSCPIPFEDWTTRDMVWIEKTQTLIDMVDARVRPKVDGKSDGQHYDPMGLIGDAGEFLQRVRMRRAEFALRKVEPQ